MPGASNSPSISSSTPSSERSDSEHSSPSGLLSMGPEDSCMKYSWAPYTFGDSCSEFFLLHCPGNDLSSSLSENSQN